MGTWWCDVTLNLMGKVKLNSRLDARTPVTPPYLLFKLIVLSLEAQEPGIPLPLLQTTPDRCGA
eukprot:1152538-Pelagomonas_calceolata.AAC.8